MSLLKTVLSPRDAAQWASVRRYGAAAFVLGSSAFYGLVFVVFGEILYRLHDGRLPFSFPQVFLGGLIWGLVVSSFLWWLQERRYKPTSEAR